MTTFIGTRSLVAILQLKTTAIIIIRRETLSGYYILQLKLNVNTQNTFRPTFCQETSFWHELVACGTDDEPCGSGLNWVGLGELVQTTFTFLV